MHNFPIFFFKTSITLHNDKVMLTYAPEVSFSVSGFSCYFQLRFSQKRERPERVVTFSTSLSLSFLFSHSTFSVTKQQQKKIEKR